MSPKLKNLKNKKICKTKSKKVVNILPKHNVVQLKAPPQFQELTYGMVIPSSVGTFKVLNELAVGRCCEVYVGEDVATKLQAAVKVFIRHQYYKGALFRELKFLGKLSPHPHIVTPKCSVQYDERDVLIHELLSGTLKDIMALQEGRSPSVWLITTLAKHLMRGLSHMHRNGVVHGDLKPHNIMWSGQQESFKLIDFGVSYSLTENLEHAIQSRAYQAPEAIQWNQWVQLKKDVKPPITPPPPKPGPPIDVWSAGCIVAELLTGEKIFTHGWNGENTEEALKSSLQKVDNKTNEFVSNMFAWLKGCLEEKSELRERAEECERAPFLLNGICDKPSIFDLLILPTTVLRVVNIFRSGMEESLVYEIVESVIEKAACVFAPSSHALDSRSGSLFLQYDHVQYSRKVLQSLKNATVHGATLVVSFFPRRLFDRKMLF